MELEIFNIIPQISWDLNLRK